MGEFAIVKYLKINYTNKKNSKRGTLMTEVVAARIWAGDRFAICQRPAYK
jgi:hypothetical protein